MPINSRQKGAAAWRAIPGYEGLYEASEYGEVRSLKRHSTSGKVLKPYCNPRNGYMYVSLSKHNKAITKRVHGLVAAAFFGIRPEGLQVNHIDGDKTNNAIGNLEYCTQSENMTHAFQTGLEKPRGLRVIDLDSKCEYESVTAAARSVGGTRGEMVARVCRGERSHYRNHHFAFYDDYTNGTIPQFTGKNTKKASESLWR